MIRWAAPSTAAARRGAVHPQTAERRPVHSADDGPRTQRPGNGAGHARSATGESTGTRGGFGGGHHDVPCTDAPPLRPPPNHRRGGVRCVGPAPPLPGLRHRRPPQPRRGGRADPQPDRPRPEGATATAGTGPQDARLKASAPLVKAVEETIRCYDRPPLRPMTVETERFGLPLDAGDWSEALHAATPGTPHHGTRHASRSRKNRSRSWPPGTTMTALRPAFSAVHCCAARNGAGHSTAPGRCRGRPTSSRRPVPASPRRCAPRRSPGESRRLQRLHPRPGR